MSINEIKINKVMLQKLNPSILHMLNKIEHYDNFILEKGNNFAMVIY